MSECCAQEDCIVSSKGTTGQEILDAAPEFFCSGGENQIDFQTGGNCAAYAADFILRSLGEQTDGEKSAADRPDEKAPR